MKNPELERFAQAVEEEETLREELWAITDPVHFVATVLRRAGERGIVLVDGEVWSAFHEGRLALFATQT